MPNNKFLFFVFSLSLLTISSCSTDKETELKKAILETEYGKDAYWLEKNSSIGSGWDKTILIFGYDDDKRFCEELITIYEEKYQQSYRCTKAKN